MADFAKHLREARERAGFTQAELAAKVRLTGSYISVLESRKKPPPSDAVVKRLAAALGVPAGEFVEIAHLDRAPDDLRAKIRALDRRLKTEVKVTKRLLSDVLPSSLWHFGRVEGLHEAAVERLRIDGRRKRLLRQIVARLGPLTSRDDFEERSRALVADLSDEEQRALADVLPELLAPAAPAAPPPGDAECRMAPLLALPPELASGAPPVLGSLPVDAVRWRVGQYFLAAPDAEMAPRVERGDLLLVDPAGEPAPGDLVLARLDGRPTVRLAAPGGTTLLLVTPGGASPPAETRPGVLLGLVRELRRLLGQPAAAMSTKPL